jgi:hypothetical protein
MSKLWHDIQTHKRAAVLFLAYWLATLAIVPITWSRGIPYPVVALLFTTPLIAGVLLGRWRASKPERAADSGCIPAKSSISDFFPREDRIRGGMLAGVLSAEITFLVMKGGAVDEVIGWIHGNRFQGDEVLGFFIVTGIFGVFLGWAGAKLAIILDRFRRHGTPTLSA